MTIEVRQLSVAERLDWLRLLRSENVGPVTFRRLLERFGSAGAALRALPELAQRGGRAKPISICPKGVAERELEAAERIGAHLLALCEPGYPVPLRAVDDGPPLLWARGNPALLMKSTVGVVGARNASASGRRIAWQLGADLGRQGLVLASGMARGIDTAVHEGSLQTGTIAVLAGGVDVVYPPENAGLYDKIVDLGCVVSEMPPGTEPHASLFPRRNRIISGLSLGVVVVEANPRSGSLITARQALDQGREVFAVPGSPLDPRCQGPNGLIRQGATLTRDANDVMEVLADLLRRPLAEPVRDLFSAAPPPIPTDSELAQARREVADALSHVPVTVDEIIRQCQLSPAVVSMVLLELELAGRLDRHPGGRVSLL